MTWDKSMENAGGGLPGLAGRYFARALGKLEHGTLDVEFADGSCQRFGGGDGLRADLRILHPWRALRRLAVQGSNGFADSYLAGDWETSDLSTLLLLLSQNEDALARASRPNPLAWLSMWLRHRLRANTRWGSRRNIAAHYDLGNTFYRQWLDHSMTYSSALFGDSATPETDRFTLEQAQNEKYQRVLKLLKPGKRDHILEIGCGWGGFASTAATVGHQVTGLSLSREQLAWARQKSHRAGLTNNVEYHYRDYRDEQGQYDHVVSIEMFEAVGERYWPAFFNNVYRRIKPGGRAALQVITIDEPAFPAYRRNPDFIQLYIFPGGMLPTTTHLTGLARAAGLTLKHMDAFGLHYAETLRLWKERFTARESTIRALGYDNHFIRMWQFYLSYCEAGFRMGRINLVQLVLERPAHPS